MTRPLIFALALTLAGCVEVTAPAGPPRGDAPARLDSGTAARNFAAVVRAVEPVAERECRARAPRLDCDFIIVIDDRPGQGVNAYHTLDGAGRPIIAFTPGLIAEARNRDELAFVMGHEASHHIAGHIPRTQQTAIAGALILGTLASIAGAGQADVQAAADIGGAVGSRTYSKGYELEADALGTVIAYRAGFDPARGAEFFGRLPDPGNRFLGSHPPNAERRATVLNTLAQLR
jgi:predicted Zn-dependent protease